MEEQFFTSQEEIINSLVYGLIFMVLTTSLLILFFYYSRKKITEKEQEKLELQIESKNRILQATINTQEEERQRIAKDLHDAISSKLNVINLTTHILLEDKALATKQKLALNHILNINADLLESSRKIAHDLMPPILEKFGLRSALEELFDEFITSKHIAIEYAIDEFKTINNTNDLHVFRILQELINNSVKHGQAKHLDIDVLLISGNLEINYRDDGIGFDVDQIEQNIGIGIQNIVSRVAILAGTLIMNSEINMGSSFIIKCNNYE